MNQRLPMLEEEKSWFLAHARFERTTMKCEYLDDDVQGAVGWFAIPAKNNISMEKILRKTLGEVELLLIEIYSNHNVYSYNDVEEFDDYLANNIKELNINNNVIWGTIHQYYGHGEA